MGLIQRVSPCTVVGLGRLFRYVFLLHCAGCAGRTGLAEVTGVPEIEGLAVSVTLLSVTRLHVAQWLDPDLGGVRSDSTVIIWFKILSARNHPRTGPLFLLHSSDPFSLCPR